MPRLPVPAMLGMASDEHRERRGARASARRPVPYRVHGAEGGLARLRADAVERQGAFAVRLGGSGLPVRAWEEAWLWRALRNRVERMERFVYDGVFRHVRPLAQTMARARRLDADDWATPRQTLPLARGFGEECNAWDSPARLWIVAAASV